jgi:hypothetical protein
MAATLDELKRRLAAMRAQGMLSGLSPAHANLSPAAKMLLNMLSRPGLLPRPVAPERPVPVPVPAPVPAPEPIAIPGGKF